MHVWPGFKIPPLQVVPKVKLEGLSMAMLLMVSGAVPVLVSVTV